MKPSAESGFTLLEVLVAFVVAAALLALAFQVGGEGFRAIGRSNDRILTTLHARSFLEAAGVAATIELGLRRGETADGFSWAVETSPAQMPGLVRLRVEVHPTGRPQDGIVLHSLRPAPGVAAP